MGGLGDWFPLTSVGLTPTCVSLTLKILSKMVARVHTPHGIPTHTSVIRISAGSSSVSPHASLDHRRCQYLLITCTETPTECGTILSICLCSPWTTDVKLKMGHSSQILGTFRLNSGKMTSRGPHLSTEHVNPQTNRLSELSLPTLRGAVRGQPGLTGAQVRPRV